MDIASDYAKQREINIANNKLLLESLGLGGWSGILGESLSKKKKKTIKWVLKLSLKLYAVVMISISDRGTTSATIANTAIKDNTDLTEATGSTTGTAAHASPTAIHNIRETAGGWYDQIDAIIN